MTRVGMATDGCIGSFGWRQSCSKIKGALADGNYEVRYKSNVLIYPNGEVLWVPPAIYQVGNWSKYRG
uniref:Uncharacterized protein n=1 Tax=Timema poppense TaxID=170557 RepID=A0A7R9H7Y1_TIMPO|nr:unnamed protein product [Timema poppensis]